MATETVKILLAEDDENLGSLLREYLNAKNYLTQLYPDGEQALEAFKNEDFDMCIIDIMMPRMDGYTLYKEIRKFNSNTP